MLSKEEFKEVFEVNFDAIRDFVFYRCGDKEVASDIAQDVFLRIWEKHGSLEAGCIRPLLYRMAADMFINRYKKELRRVNYWQDLGQEEGSGPSPEEEMIGREAAAAYTEALEQMPEARRKVYLMSREEGMKYREIAGRLHLSVKTVEKHISAALRLLRTKFR